MDTVLAHARQLGGDALAPSAMSLRHRDRERQLQAQKDISAAWAASASARSGYGSIGFCSANGSGYHEQDGAAVASARAANQGNSSTAAFNATAPASTRGTAKQAGVLQVPVLATVAPSFTKAADDGVEALGGTMTQGPGYTSVVGLIPTINTVALIEDDYELVSSMRPYRYDAARQVRRAALRDNAAPLHPDLVRQLEPALTSVCPTDLVDVDSLPREYLLYAARGMTARGEEGEGQEDGGNADNAAAGAHGDVDEKNVLTEQGMRRGAGEGTYPFLCQGRPATSAEAHRLPGRRQPGLGQYEPRYSVVDARTTGGYIQPATSAARIPRGRSHEVDATAPAGANAAGAVDRAGAASEASVASVAAALLQRTAGDIGASREDILGSTFGATAYSGTLRRGLNTHSGGGGGGGTDTAAEEKTPRKPGENVKGSSMFLSKTERGVAHGTAAPDAVYWPYPDARSTSRRTPCAVQYDVPTHTRRRVAPVSSVPSAVYEVAGDVAQGCHRVVDMRASTGREGHWYGRQLGGSQWTGAQTGARSTDVLDVDAALRATRPAARVVTLPPREGGATDGGSSTRAGAGTQGAAMVSVEMNLAYPPPVIGDPRKLANVRSFEHMTARPQRSFPATVSPRFTSRRGSGGGGAGSQGKGEDASPLEGAYAVLEHRSPAAHIHPRAPGHGSVALQSTPTEFGPAPSLKLVRPNQERATAFGKGSRRPDHLLGFHDLTYDANPGYAATEPRVRGGPPLGTMTSREHREKVFTQRGCGPKDVVAYDNVNLVQPPRSTPQFDKQITKETQFAGHRIQSERWMRRNPRAPGPGYYDVSYAAVM